LNAGGAVISEVCRTTPLTFGVAETPRYGTGVTPAGTVGLLVSKVADTNMRAAAGGITFRKIKVELGISSSLYSWEALLTALGMGPNPAPLFAAAGTQSGHAVNLGQFASSIVAGPGYTKLPNGLIIQWGSATSAGGTPNLTWTFPLTFPNQCNAVIGQPGAAGSIATLLAQTPALAKQSSVFNIAAANGGAAMSGVAVGLISVGF
jgi:hypothetical protein